jgi:hypothetical protein
LWPVAPSLVDDIAEGGGIASVGSKLRWQNREVVVIKGRDEELPVNKKFRVRLSCSQKHPGLCLSQDRDVYDDVLLIARRLELALPQTFVSEFYKVGDSEHSIVVFFAHVRVRRPHAQQTHVFVECDITSSGEAGDIVAFKHRSDLPCYHFLSVWDIGKRLLRQGCGCIEVVSGTSKCHATAAPEALQSLSGCVMPPLLWWWTDRFRSQQDRTSPWLAVNGAGRSATSLLSRGFTHHDEIAAFQASVVWAKEACASIFPTVLVKPKPKIPDSDKDTTPLDVLMSPSKRPKPATQGPHGSRGGGIIASVYVPHDRLNVEGGISASVSVPEDRLNVEVVDFAQDDSEAEDEEDMRVGSVVDEPAAIGEHDVHGPSGSASSSGAALPPARSAQSARAKRGTQWPPQSSSSWTIAPVYVAGEHKGWGVECGMHCNKPEGGTKCKKMLMIAKGLDSQSCKERLMQWLLEGTRIPNGHDSRTKHVQEVRPRDLPPRPEAELTQEALEFWSRPS